MKFLQIINHKKFILISILLFIYVLLNFLDGERGLVSYYEKLKIKDQLIEEEKLYLSKLISVKKNNNLLTENIDLDYLEIQYRKKFMLGKANEKIYKSN